MATLYSDKRYNGEGTCWWRLRVDYSGTTATAYADVGPSGWSIYLRFTTGTNTFYAESKVWYASNNGGSSNKLGSITISETSATTITQTCSGSTWGGNVNGSLSVTIPAQKGSFNLNLLNPSGTEVNSAAGSVEQSVAGGSYQRISNETGSIYGVGTVINYRNFTPGAGQYLASVSGLSPNNTSGPWSVTVPAGGTTVSFRTGWNTYYRDINAWKPGNSEQNGLMFDYYIYNRDGGLVNSYTNKTNEVENTVTREYGYTGKINNIRSNVTGAHYTTNNITGTGASEFTWTFNNTNAVELYSAWNTYTVVYHGNGATGGSTSNSSHTYNTAKNLTNNGYSRSGYDFLGWNTSSSASSPSYSNGQSVSNLTATNGGTVNLYAIWRETIPSNLQINGYATSPFTIDLNWSAVGVNITNFTVYYNGTAKNCGTATSTTIDVNEETTYNIYFTATNAGGTTTSGTISVTTPADQAKMRIRTKTESEHPVFEGYTPVQYITATALDQRIELDHDRFHDYEVILKLKWNDITTEQNIGSYHGGYFGVSNGYYTSKGQQTTMPAVVGREDTVRLVSEFLYDANEGVEPGPNYIYGGSIHYQVTLYVNDDPIDSYETTSSSSMPSYSYFHLFGVYGIDNGSTASIYSYSDPYMTLLPYVAADGTPVFISQDGEVYRFDGEPGKVGAGFGEWLRGKVFYKKDGRWVKAKKIYQKSGNIWKAGTNVEPGDLTFWKQSHSGIWTINYDYKTGLSDVTCNGKSGWWEHLYKIYSTEPGATYTVEFDYYNPKGYSPDYGGIECQASNVLENNNGDERKIGYVSLESTASSLVQHLSFTFTATQTETCIGFNFGRGSDTSPVNIHIGNIFVRKN